MMMCCYDNKHYTYTTELDVLRIYQVYGGDMAGFRGVAVSLEEG